MGKAKMKKLTFFVYHKEYHEFLQQMQELGVVHVQTSAEGTVLVGSELADKMEHNKHLRALIAQLSALSKAPRGGYDGAPEVVIERIDAINNAIKPTLQEAQRAQADVEALKPWGDFDRRSVAALAEVGYSFHYCKCAKKQFDVDALADYSYAVASDNGKEVYFVVVTPLGEVAPAVGQELTLPECSLSEAVARVAALQEKSRQLDAELAELADTTLPALRCLEKEWSTSIAFDKVVLDTTRVAEDKLMVLEGWIPEEKEAPVEEWLSKQGAYYEIRKPNKDDVVPVLFKNNAFTKMYEVLTRMYGMPNYTDFDPTPIVAPFFSLFFAFCMGDAGYGLVLILLGFFLKKKLGKSMAGMMNLVMTLGVFTTVLGAIFGTFFGISLLGTNLPQGLKDLIFAGQVEVMGATYDKLMILSLAIGVIHISIAMTVKAINVTLFNGFKEAISAWGWWLVVVGGVIVGTLTLLSIIPSDVSQWVYLVVAGVGAVGIYLLNNLGRNVFVNIGAGIWDTYNMASGLMGDILSYIRLFALGLAGGMLGQTFNDLALMVVEGQEGVGAVIGWIGFGLIIVFGHTLNIAMSCLSAFVHPLRLTFVEYFKNAGYEGKGVEYKPFSIEKVEE
ncbi:MAG: ATPase V [Bacteroides sp.]|nr:ATPase V [Bacteroides sp.]